MRVMMQAADYGESPLTARMREHVGQDPKELPSTAADFAPTEHPNVQLGLALGGIACVVAGAQFLRGIARLRAALNL